MKKKSKALDVLIQFLGDMNEWESSFFREKLSLIEKGIDASSCSERYKNILEEILQKYSIKSSKCWARLEGLACGEPTMYDPIRDKVETDKESEQSASFIVEQSTGLEASFKFTMTNSQSGWMIRKKETLRRGKWQESTL
ncbi:NTF2 fold immunity protein [Pseudomonas syringae]|uniref:NTF2 fold immunity protein n=1 Tax=Pseudomonas syringae TaxID=317 RepID=UPI000465E038|nr:NTF2 fold immunity protein [Pseudomonas syringae]